MRSLDPSSSEPHELSLFEQWMGLTPEEWEALADGGHTAPDEKLQLI